MVFSSLIFLFGFLAVTLGLYYAVPRKLKNLVLFVMSLLFYGWAEPFFIIIMMVSVASAFFLGFPIAKHKESNLRKARGYLVLSLALNLVWLLFFKYLNFFIENLSAIPFLSGLQTVQEYSLPFVSEFPFSFVLPLGISFYTFQIMSYSIDLYRGQTEVQRNFISFGAYVTLFPQLVAGPIVRYRDVDDMLAERKETVADFAAGARRFCAGMCKKVLLADVADSYVNYFNAGLATESTVLGGWLVVIFYTFRIYFDFSAYSDMAIGLGKIFGFHFLENFDYPYISKSITEFWRRWHISLSSWFREYVYIPLGGNRRGKVRQYINLAVVWLLTGFWHGASWNFIIWGVYFLILLVMEKAFLLKALEKIPAFFSHIYALLFVAIGWLIFYYTDTAAGLNCLKAMFGAGNLSTATVGFTALHALPTLLLFAVASTPYPKKLWDTYVRRTEAGRIFAAVLPVLGLFLCVSYMVASSYSPFLYWNF
ncbi:MAG: MBOAT family protein [Clostridia bacterium]|nr:MBOAT family protein [Clostridia bacterium]